jgi:hypothetical protein
VENVPRGRLLLHAQPSSDYLMMTTQMDARTQDRNGGAVPWMISHASAASIPIAPSMVSGEQEI